MSTDNTHETDYSTGQLTMTAGQDQFPDEEVGQLRVLQEVHLEEGPFQVTGYEGDGWIHLGRKDHEFAMIDLEYVDNVCELLQRAKKLATTPPKTPGQRLWDALAGECVLDYPVHVTWDLLQDSDLKAMFERLAATDWTK